MLMTRLCRRVVGNCVTGIGSDEVCGLSSTSIGCSATNNLATVDCLCHPGVNHSDDCHDSGISPMYFSRKCFS